jgi:hypothetical protein
MRTILVFLSALLFAGVATGQMSQSLPPETVVSLADLAVLASRLCPRAASLIKPGSENAIWI